MDIKKIVLLVAVSGFLPISLAAQDDMYFRPQKTDKKDVLRDMPSYNSTEWNIDEYNRRERSVGEYRRNVDLDTLYSDIILLDTSAIDSTSSFELEEYAYTPEEDYVYSRNLSRFDDFYWYDPWYFGWRGYGPYWYGSPYWYAGWWYDPWYDPWFYGWHRPWGWYYSWYWPVSYYRPYRGITGTTNHGRIYGNHGGTANNFRGYRGNNRKDSNRTFSGNRYNNKNNNTNYNRFRGNRQNQNNFNQRNYQNRPSYNNSFGGNRSGGSFRGGGSFGGSRSGGGGGGFRGRR